MNVRRLMMLLFASAAVLFVGCEKEKGYSGSGGQQQATTTYDVYVHDITVPSTVSIECLVIEYSNQNEPLETYRFNVSSQEVIHRQYTATKNSVKVKVAFNVRSTTSSQSAVRWIQKVFYLSIGGNTQVEITGSSPSGSSEP